MTPRTRSSEPYALLREHGLFVVSNRGPVTYQLAQDGSVSAQHSAGGVATAFLSLARHLPFTWVAAAVTPGDRAVAKGKAEIVLGATPTSHPLSVHLVRVPQLAFRRFSTVVANSLLWPLHHYLLDPNRLASVAAPFYTAWLQGYVPVNQAFARAVLDLVGRAATQPVILLQDYHLFLVAAFLRPQLPKAVISHFLHIPWPGPRYWMMLPRAMREAILDGLGQCDVVGLQTEQDVRNLLDSWEITQRGATVDRERGAVITAEERLVMVRAYPISVDVAHLEESARSPRSLRYREALGRYRREKLIVRVDRLDSSKNVARGFLAYERLLEEHPELHGRVQFLALLVPSRQEVAAYRRNRKLVERIVGRVNARFGRRGWQPIVTRNEENHERAVAILQEYDVLLVNSLMDGMNLVAKEGCVLNGRNGVIVLSETAGCYSELAPGVLAVGPADVAGTSTALYEALTMNGEERARRAALLRTLVQERPLTGWLEAQLRDLEAIVEARR